MGFDFRYNFSKCPHQNFPLAIYVCSVSLILCHRYFYIALHWPCIIHRAFKLYFLCYSASGFTPLKYVFPRFQSKTFWIYRIRVGLELQCISKPTKEMLMFHLDISITGWGILDFRTQKGVDFLVVFFFFVKCKHKYWLSMRKDVKL